MLRSDLSTGLRAVSVQRINSAMPASKSRVGLKPKTRSIFATSAKQWRMSPTRYLFRISGAMFLCRSSRQRACDLVDRDGPSAADVEDVPDLPIAFQDRCEGIGDVQHMHEVALLLAILEDERRLVVQQPGNEDRRDPRVGIAERLPGSVGIEQPQGNSRDAESAPDRQKHLLVIALVDGIDRGRLEAFLLGRGDWVQRLAIVRQVPPLLLQLFMRANWRSDRRPRGR